MIPKTIHYCWFGGNELPDNLKRCINSWSVRFPDYDIKEWNEQIFDVNSHPFVKQAYESKKYAFVSDYVRIYALYNWGGIYLDTDVEVCKSMDDLLNKRAFLAIEPETFFIATCCMGFEKKHPFLDIMLRKYDKLVFDKTPNTIIFYNTIKEIYGNKFVGNNCFEFEDMTIFPSNFISLRRKYKDNYIIHYCSASWLSPYQQKKQKVILFMLRYSLFNNVCKNRVCLLLKNINKICVKVIFGISKCVVAVLNRFSPRFAMKLYVPILKLAGVKINGKPRFISTRIRFDEFPLIEIGDKSVVSERVVFLTHDYSCTNALRLIGFPLKSDISWHAPIVLGKNVFVGLGCILLPGTTIDDDVIVGAGAVVKGHLKSGYIYVGNPASPLKKTSDYANSIEKRIENENFIYDKS